jgi:hypothetical protein
MDPLSVSTGVLTLISLGIQLGISLNRTKSAFQNALPEYNRLKSELSSFNLVLEHIRRNLGDQLTHKASLAEALGQTLSPCETTLSKLINKLDYMNLESPTMFGKLRGKKSFVMSRADFQEVRLELSSYKESIILILQLHSM